MPGEENNRVKSIQFLGGQLLVAQAAAPKRNRSALIPRSTPETANPDLRRFMTKAEPTYP